MTLYWISTLPHVATVFFHVVGEILKANLLLFRTTVLNETVAYGGFVFSPKKREASAYKIRSLIQFL